MAKINPSLVNNFVLTFILFTASFLRLWQIDKVPISMFSDELDVGYQAYSLIKTGRDYFGNAYPILFHSYADFRTPLYIYASVPSVFVFGITPLGVRLPAAIFGVLGVWGIYLLFNQIFKKNLKIANLKFGIFPALILTLSPWHIQYSRAGFEATMLLTFIIFGLFFFFKALGQRHSLAGFKEEGIKIHLLLSSLFLALTPWIYSTAKLFTPLIIFVLIFIWKKDVFKLARKLFLVSALFLIVFYLPLLFIKGSSLRFSYISVFTDPTAKPEVDYQILYDAKVRQKYGGNLLSKVLTRLVHNKYTFWTEKIVDNFFQTFSTEFLFTKGDLNLRHSIEGVGQFYKIEFITLIIGSAFFFFKFKDKKVKLLILAWILIGVIPSSLTRDGGSHATRLILILPPLVFLISFGIFSLVSFGGKNFGRYLLLGYLVIWFLLFGYYQHLYWVHNPWYSERAWHAGYKELVNQVKSLEADFDKIIISNANDDPKIFLASYYPIEPQIWQKGMEKEFVEGFGILEHVGKYYFGQVDGTIGIDKVSKYLNKKILYAATQREVKGNLIMSPDKIPDGLRLIKAVVYPSGEPAFYLFEKEKV